MLRQLQSKFRSCRSKVKQLGTTLQSTNRLFSTSNLQVMIFGSSTGVGKTIVSAGVCRAALTRKHKVCYIKPLQTGELDEYFVNFYTNPQGICDIFLRTLHHWSSSMPPHVAAADAATPISDKDLTLGLEREMRAFSNSAAAQPGSKGPQLFTVVETAGGVLSPGPSRNLQADIYRTFRFPIILVGDSKLGGITTTLSAYESLRLRGYTVHAIVMIEHPGTNKYGNVVMIREHLERSLSFSSHTERKKIDSYSSLPSWVANRVPKVFRMFPLPSDKMLHHWFTENSDEFEALFDHVEAAVGEEQQRLMAMRRDGQKSVWWPFTQHASVVDGNVTFIESAHGDKFRVIRHVAEVSESDQSAIGMKKEDAEIKLAVTDLFDGCGSWWTQGIGHGNPSMSLALAEAAGRYGHVMFPSNLHPPAVQLAQYLLEKGPGKGWANRVFYSDDGSTGMEVAIKMALRLWDIRVRNSIIKTQPKPVGESDEIGEHMKSLIVLTQRDCYHGDTLGTMDTAERGPFNHAQHPWYRPRTAALPLPLVAYRNGRLTVDASEMTCSIDCIPNTCKCVDMARVASSSPPWGSIEAVMNVKSRVGSDLERVYHNFIESFLDDCDSKGMKIGAFLLEPLMLGAGGLKFIDPLFQKIAVQGCRSRGIPIVYDEVAVGMYRLGPSSTSSILHEYPDIAVYGKMLSGGYMPLAATLATTETFNAFLGKKKWHALLHGHSFTANPIACAASLERARLIEGGLGNTWYDPAAFGGMGGVKASFTESDVRDVSLLPGVKGAMSLGSVLSVELGNSTPAGVMLERPPVEFTDTAENESDSSPSLGNSNFPVTALAEAAGDVSASKNARYYSSNASAIVVSLLKQNNVYARPLGNVVYLMPTPLTPEADRQRLIRVIKRCITKAFYLRQPNSLDVEDNSDAEAGPNIIV